MVHWNIVEQPMFVDVGKKYFENDILKFYYDIESCMADQSPTTILLSSVIQYLEQPYAFLKTVKSLGFEFILFDRTSFIKKGGDRLTVQTVCPEIYRASYPCWFFDRKKFNSFFDDDYETIAEFQCHENANIPSFFKGLILKRR